MQLPVIDLPEFEVALPSDGRKVSLRPFRVKEEKILLMAVESENVGDIIRSTLQVVQNCILTKGIHADKLPAFDVD